jgi:hypothetical protein
MSSDIGVDLAREMRYARGGFLEDVDMEEVGAGLLRYERSVGGRMFS